MLFPLQNSTSLLLSRLHKDLISMRGTLILPSPFSFNFQSRHRGMPACASVAEAGSHSVAEVNRKNLYQVLRVERNASQMEIKTAYRTLAKLYHPDAASRFMDSSIALTSDVRDFIEIHDAYATLSDPDARAVYDLCLNVGSQRRWATAGLSGFHTPGRGRFYRTRRWETDQCW